jgi:hypothetical protein
MRRPALSGLYKAAPRFNRVHAYRWPGAVANLAQSPMLSGSRRALVAAEQSAETFGLDDFTCTAAITRSG